MRSFDEIAREARNIAWTGSVERRDLILIAETAERLAWFEAQYGLGGPVRQTGDGLRPGIMGMGVPEPPPPRDGKKGG